ncbi:MAG: SMC family ATPase [Gorillibacterium sp.]|nr:SMC family ATPase [Gorillibacterium sp.]
MKPLKLTMTAFGPYKDSEVIDFSELKGHRLFVISGNTGSGKTSIFDAICFALYGVASGEDRNDSKMLRSDFADDNAYTCVDFIFELKNRVYRILRQLPHVKTGNKSATGERYELYEIVKGDEIPLTDRFIVSQVDQKLQEIIGLTKDQFSQIVMLPQGEFRKLLTSETENKEEILRRIFKTSLYKFVADLLNEKRRKTQRSCEELAGIRAYHFNNVKGSLAGRVGSDLTSVFEQEHYNTFQVLEALDKELIHYAERISQNKLLLQVELTKLQENTLVYHQASSLNEQFQQLDQKNALRQQLDAQEQAFKQKTQHLLLAEQAVHLQVYERHHAELSAEFTRKSQLLAVAQSERTQAEAALQVALTRYQLEEANAERREQTVRELTRLQGLLPTVQEIDRKQHQVTTLAAEVAVLTKEWQAAEALLAAKQAERATIATGVKELEGKLAGLAEKTEQLTLLREQATIIKEYIKLRQKIEGEQQEELQHGVAFAQAEKSYEALELRWMEGQAGILASHLHDGEACPVCGGIDHPLKAMLSDDIPTKEELDRLRREKTSLEKQHMEAKAVLRATRQQGQEKERQVLEHGYLVDNIKEQYQQLMEVGKALAEEEKQLKGDQAQLTQLKPLLEILDNAITDSYKLKEDLASRVNDKNTVYATEKALFAHALASIPEDVRSLLLLEQRIRSSEELKQQLELAWKRAQQVYQEGSERNVKATVSLGHALREQNEAQVSQVKARNSYDDALQQAGFVTEAAYRAAKLSETERGELKRQIEQYNARLAAVCKQIEELVETLNGKERQDLAVLQQQIQVLEQQIDVLRNQSIGVQNDYDKGTECKADIVQTEEKWQEAERQHQLVKDLYDVIRGENIKKVSFERYLQIEFLEKIIHTANQRLQHMSGGQYYLIRSDRLEKRGRQSGLGLDVFDNYTGLLRDVKTLSGGEKFNASLCLALGMADVIQAYEGGISLETMFIDEGFGSLDEESLNKAIETLIDLQESGRMIGIISHVQELKQAIPAVLEVKKTREGHSYTQFFVS